MKRFSLILLTAVAIASAGLADAAPKKRTRNSDRIGPYGAGTLGYSSWSSDQSRAEDVVLGVFEDNEVSADDVSMKTTKNDLGYALGVGYRFSRYFAAELSLASYGSVESVGRAEVETTGGLSPVDIKLEFSASGPLFSAIGILPVNDKFEVYARLGYLFTSSERELTSRVNGQRGGLFGNSKGESQDVILGVGAAYNFNQQYALRLEYQQIDALGEASATGEEEVSQLSLGAVIRF